MGERSGVARGGWKWLAMAGAMAALLLLPGALPARRADAAPTWLVASTADVGSCGFPIPTSCDLRGAIMAANFAAGSTIAFDLGSSTIKVNSPLPPITAAGVTIDGTTDPGYAGTPLIEVNGSVAGPGANGLLLLATGVTVKGLVINGFDGNGVEVDVGGNSVTGNYIGTNKAGTAAAANNHNGILVNGAASNLISGNVISGNKGAGILVDGPAAVANSVAANSIGTNAAGNAAVPNAVGIELSAGAHGNFLGLDLAGNGNLISGNSGAGVLLASAGDSNIIVRNCIGVAAGCASALPNGGDGVAIEGTNQSFLGGGSGAGNIVSGNTANGVAIRNSSWTTVDGNFIGTDSPGTSAVANGQDGVLVDGATNNTIGSVVGNIISGNSNHGVEITGAASAGNTVQGNLVGVAADGGSELPNGWYGVALTNGAVNNTVGGPARNVISGNLGGGVGLGGVDTSYNKVVGNYIGTNAAGTAAVLNFAAADGVVLSGGAHHNTIGDGTIGGRNVISGNSQNGVTIQDAPLNTIAGNYIGLNPAGTTALPNASAGVGVLASIPGIASVAGTVIGGTTAGAGNVISGNTNAGIDLETAASVTVEGNLVGTNAAGTSPAGNGAGGILVSGGGPAGNTIGGAAAGAGNVISGNSGDGVRLTAGAVQDVVAGNFIGTDVTGVSGLPNGRDGVRLEGTSTSGNTIGGIIGGGPLSPLAGTPANTIAFNTSAGVRVLAGIENSVLGNAVWSNGGGGVLVSVGANNNQDTPVVYNASSGTSVAIKAKLLGYGSTTYRVEFFSSAACDPSGSGQGQLYVGWAAPTLGPLGMSTFFAYLPSALTPGSVVTAIATSPTGDSSSFSNCQTVTAPACPDDTDCDGYLDGDEVGLGKDPFTYCATMRADVNGDHVVNLLDLAKVAAQFGQSIPPGDPRYDQNSDGKVNLLDLAKQAAVYAQNVSACP